LIQETTKLLITNLNENTREVVEEKKMEETTAVVLETCEDVVMDDVSVNKSVKKQPAIGH
jgi:hypothetical protein